MRFLSAFGDYRINIPDSSTLFECPLLATLSIARPIASLLLSPYDSFFVILIY